MIRRMFGFGEFAVGGFSAASSRGVISRLIVKVNVFIIILLFWP